MRELVQALSRDHQADMARVSDWLDRAVYTSYRVGGADAPVVSPSATIRHDIGVIREMLDWLEANRPALPASSFFRLGLGRLEAKRPELEALLRGEQGATFPAVADVLEAFSNHARLSAWVRSQGREGEAGLLELWNLSSQPWPMLALLELHPPSVPAVEPLRAFGAWLQLELGWHDPALLERVRRYHGGELDAETLAALGEQYLNEYGELVRQARGRDTWGPAWDVFVGDPTTFSVLLCRPDLTFDRLLGWLLRYVDVRVAERFRFGTGAARTVQRELARALRRELPEPWRGG